ncbi:MAG: TetR/AcrR family transcriptional regulator [Rhodospirillales bacterium]
MELDGTTRSRAEMIAETRGKLLSAARHAFGTLGYAETSMDDLCAEVGLTRGALYHHFGGKAGLLEVVAKEMNAEIDARLDAHYATFDDPWAAFCDCCRAYLRMALEPEIQRILFRDAPAVLGQRLREMDEEGSIVPLAESLSDLIAKGRIVDCDAELMARFLNGALVDTALWIAAGDRPEARLARSERTVDLLLGRLER